VDERRAVAPACGSEIEWPLSVDGERAMRLLLRAVDRVVRRAVEDDVRPTLPDDSGDSGRVENRNLVVREAGVRAE
jgi:hypothetical protein